MSKKNKKEEVKPEVKTEAITGSTEQAKELVSIEDHIERIKYLLDSGIKGHREIDLAVSDAMIALEKVSSLVKFIAAAEASLAKKK